MSWYSVFQTGLAGIGAWFLYELVKEFKSFKSETKRDLANLEKQRAAFENSLRQTDLSMRMRVEDLRQLQHDHNLQAKHLLSQIKTDVTRIEIIAENLEKKTLDHEAFMKKYLQVSKVFNEKIKNHESEIKSLQLKLGDLTIIKSGK